MSHLKKALTSAPLCSCFTFSPFFPPTFPQVLRETGCLNGVITTDSSKSDEELVAMTKNWTIVGQDLLTVVSCKEPYEWKDPTQEEWEFNEDAKAAAAAKQFKVSS